MCGIVAVIRRRPTRRPPDPGTLERTLVGARQALDAVLATAGDRAAWLPALDGAASSLEAVDRALRGRPGLEALLGSLRLATTVASAVEHLVTRLDAIEADLDAAPPPPEVVEPLNAGLVRLRDACWSLGVDRLGTARRVASLAGTGPTGPALDAFLAVDVALAGIGRLEVRGRDSAGLHVLVHGHDLDLDAPEVRAELDRRGGDRLFGSGSVRVAEGSLAFVYKVAAEIGELGDNVEELRTAVAGDRLLAAAVRGPQSQVAVVGHTRWASVGIISAANAHPLDHEEQGATATPARPYAVAVLNGDVDNHAQLRAAEGLDIAPPITTDAKVVPVLLSRRLAAGALAADAFRATVASLEGSVAVTAQVASRPHCLLLAQRGSGQGLYAGLAEDAFVVASEPYGLVQETRDYLRLEGENGGQVVALDRSSAGELAGIDRTGYDGRPDPVAAGEVVTAEITTRDIDRRGYPHFLLKEIAESPRSVRKTLRGRVVEEEGGGRLTVELGDEALGPELRARLARGAITRVAVIGQGTAAVAGQAVAAALRSAVGSALAVEALPATELSGFGLAGDMADTLVVAISQSGTTTDTNRTVELARARGAAVVAVVNRRNSDLGARADGVLYTSDGRDIEMSVASTKAFYAQVVAGTLLALAVARVLGRDDGDRTHALLGALRALPGAMEQVLSSSEDVARAARAEAPRRRYWAVVGSGLNRIAATEVRIKLSELCYKSIACDVTEDKKHIDLSSEPLILLCAAGLSGTNADDVAKEVQIYRAHRAAPVVIATEGPHPFDAALHVLAVPAVHAELAFVLSSMVGHLFGYHAALAIDAQALPLREARAGLRAVVARAAENGERHGPLGPAPADAALEELAEALGEPARRFLAGVASGAYDGHLEASTALRLASLLRYGTGLAPLDAYELEHGSPASPALLLDELSAALTTGINELSRPVDAIKHQAKTVTVGISRSEDALIRVGLVQAVLAAAPILDRLAYRNLRQLVALDPAVAAVEGYTRYRLDDGASAKPTIHVVDQGGAATGLASRTEADPTLRGTKRGAVDEREVTVAVGRSDGRTVVLVPEVRGQHAVGLLLLHVRFRDRLDAEVARSVLRGYRERRYEALVNAVTETESSFDEARLASLGVLDLLVAPVLDLAERWREG